MRQNDRPDGSGNLSNYYPTGNKIEKKPNPYFLERTFKLTYFFRKKIDLYQNDILFGPKLHNCNHATECSVFKNKPGQQMYFSVC